MAISGEFHDPIRESIVTLELKISHADGSIEVGDVETAGPSGSPLRCRMTFRSDRRNLTFENSDFFECLIELCQALEKEEAKALCHGARKDTYPSGMARDMSNGMVAYQLELGRHGRTEDVVHIFDPAPAELIGTVREQRDFFEAWLVSLGWQWHDGKLRPSSHQKPPR